MRKIITLIALLFVFEAHAENIRSIYETKALCGKSAEHFAKGDIKKFNEVLIPHWPLSSEQLKSIVHQNNGTLFVMLDERFGRMLGTDYVGTDYCGKKIIQHTYYLMFKKKAVRYSCVFYKPKDEWIINDINWES